MSLKDTLYTDLLDAMKSKDDIKLNALRMVKAAIMKWEVDGEKKVAGDVDVTNILKKEIKQRKDAAEQFKVGNRPELAAKEEEEEKILSTYLPEQMSEEEVKKIVQEVISKIGAKGPQDFGKVMGMVMGQLKGKAEGDVVQRVVKEELKA